MIPESVRGLMISEEELSKELEAAMENCSDEEMGQLYESTVEKMEEGSIVDGVILKIEDGMAVIDVGYKSEGSISLGEFENADELKPGDKVEVLLDSVEDDTGSLFLSKRKADRIRGWEKVTGEHSEGGIVSGRAIKKIKGGLLVDIGVPVFLPASQIDIRRVNNVEDFLGRELECKIIKIDPSRRNIVVSRRRLLEDVREEKKKELFATIELGELRKGVVKNITDFGAFVDLGGVDGLLHITDMSWARVSHPSEVVAIEDEIEVMILDVNKEKEKISLGLKQKTPSPWQNIDEKYPVGERVKGTVVNLVSYGAFVKLEPGVEGLVHVSQMSWTRRVNHPSEVVAIGDTVEVVVLDIDLQKQEISLGMKQTESNPWALVEEKYPPGTKLSGRVRNLTNYGAFVELEERIDGLLHISDMSWTKKVRHPQEVVKKGDMIDVVVLSVDQPRKRVAIGMKQLLPDPWEKEIPDRYQIGEVIKGCVVKLTSFGAFVELEPGLDGLLHASEMHERANALAIGDIVNVRVLRVDSVERRIALGLASTDEEAIDYGAGKEPRIEKGEDEGEDQNDDSSGDGELAEAPETAKETAEE